MASSPITSWQIDRETMETVTDFIFLVSKITAYGDWSYEIKRHLLLGRKAMTHLDSTLKNGDITLPTKVCLVKAMVFPIIMYGCECWTKKKAECWRIDAFELWCWRILLSIPWTARRFNQSILKEISPEYSTLWLPDAKNWLISKDPDAGKYWRQEKGTTEDEIVDDLMDLINMSLSKLWELLMDRVAWLAAVHGVAKSWTWLSDFHLHFFVA